MVIDHYAIKSLLASYSQENNLMSYAYYYNNIVLTHDNYWAMMLKLHHILPHNYYCGSIIIKHRLYFPCILSASELERISTGFAIGFGSFVDKPTLPYAHDNYER